MKRIEVERQYVKELGAVMDSFSNPLKRLVEKIGKPRFVVDDRHPRFLYGNPGARTLLVLMLVRIVSGLRAALALVWYGHVIEASCLIRTIDEFVGNIMFVKEALDTGTPTADQQKYIDDYFIDRDQTLEEMLEKPARAMHVPRKQKIRASEARQLKPEDPHSVVQASDAIDSVYDGFIHGDYSSVMQMYVGGSTEGFAVTGMQQRIPEHRKELANYVHRTMNVMGIVAHGLGLDEVTHELREMRRSFEVTPVYARTAKDATNAASLNAEDDPKEQMEGEDSHHKIVSDVNVSEVRPAGGT
jgi:hypothetical protein